MNKRTVLIQEPDRLRMLAPRTGRVRAVPDTDTFNEIDDQITYSADRTRHLVRYVTQVQRDPIFQDFIEKPSAAAGNTVDEKEKRLFNT